ncbi:MAG: hypothetical protein WBH75_19445, partial [Thermoanaerobaculia bacterium]
CEESIVADTCCPDCQGQKKVICDHCFGTGFDMSTGTSKNCPKCTGSGKIMCKKCLGTGLV